MSVVNRAPTVTATAQMLRYGQTITGASLLAAVDADGDAIATYQFLDPSGGGSITLNGAVNLLDASYQAQGYYRVSAADLAKVRYTAGSADAAETLTVWASDGVAWGAQTVALTTVNRAPTVTTTAQTLRYGQTITGASLFAAVDADGDAIATYQFLDPSGGGSIALNGAVNLLDASYQAQGYYRVSAADLAKVRYTAGSADAAETLTVWASDGVAWGAQTVALTTVNRAPTVTTTAQTAHSGQTITGASLFAAVDADGDAIATYQFLDPSGGGSIALNGAVNLLDADYQAQGYYRVSAADLAKVRYTVGAGTETLTVWASDGVAWGSRTVAVTGVNAAPTVTTTAQTAHSGQTIAASSLLSAVDADDDAIVAYQFLDPSGGGSIALNGAVNLLDADYQAQGYYRVSAADLAKVRYTAGSGVETLTVWASDGVAWGSRTVAVTGVNAAPTVTATARSLTFGQTIAVSSLLSAVDADDDAIVAYQFLDPSGGGSITLNGAVNLLDAGYQAQGYYRVSAADLAKVRYTAGSADASETLTVWASDGYAWGGRTVALATANHAPTVTAAAQTLRPGQTVTGASLLSAVDADDDAIVAYQFLDPSGGGSITLNGAVNLLNATYQAQGYYRVSAADLAKVRYTAGSANGTETLTVWASDGYAWGGQTAAFATVNRAPTVTTTSQSLTFGQTITGASLFAAVDADDDAIVAYQFLDPSGGGSITLNGAVNLLDASYQAQGYYRVSAADLAKVRYTAGGGVETLTVWASDGYVWSGADVAVMPSGWIASLTDAGLRVAVAAAAADKAITYSEMLKILTDAGVGGVTAAEFADLKSIVANWNNGITMSTYVHDVGNRLINGDAANAYWWGGTTSRTALGNLVAGSGAAQMTKLIQKWFLGGDLPSPTDSYNNVYTYTTNSRSLFGASGTASVRDINQGYLGDCFLLASMASVAVCQPSVIKSMFVDNGNNTWGVRFYIGGKEQWVTVNNQLPTAFNSSTNIWSTLLEKAYAQLNSSGVLPRAGANTYSSIEGGSANPITEITGRSLSYYNSTNYSAATWNTYKQIFIDAVSQNREIYVGSSNNITYGGKATFYSSHAYSVVGYDSSTGKFILRNPWGGEGAVETADHWIASKSGSYWTQFEAGMSDLYADYARIYVANGDGATNAAANDSVSVASTTLDYLSATGLGTSQASADIADAERRKYAAQYGLLAGVAA